MLCQCLIFSAIAPVLLTRTHALGMGALATPFKSLRSLLLSTACTRIKQHAHSTRLSSFHINASQCGLHSCPPSQQPITSSYQHIHSATSIPLPGLPYNAAQRSRTSAAPDKARSFFRGSKCGGCCSTVTLAMQAATYGMMHLLLSSHGRSAMRTSRSSTLLTTSAMSGATNPVIWNPDFEQLASRMLCPRAPSLWKSCCLHLSPPRALWHRTPMPLCAHALGSPHAADAGVAKIQHDSLESSYCHMSLIDRTRVCCHTAQRNNMQQFCDR